MTFELEWFILVLSNQLIISLATTFPSAGGKSRTFRWSCQSRKDVVIVRLKKIVYYFTRRRSVTFHGELMFARRTEWGGQFKRAMKSHFNSEWNMLFFFQTFCNSYNQFWTKSYENISDLHSFHGYILLSDVGTPNSPSAVTDLSVTSSFIFISAQKSSREQ